MSEHTEPVVPFESSRRLLGANRFFDGVGVVLQAGPEAVPDDAALARWRAGVEHAREALGWPPGAVVARRHTGGVVLAFEAPLDQLFTATEVNEWSLYTALGIRAGAGPADPDSDDPRPHVAHFEEAEAMARLLEMARAEADPALMDLLDAAARRGIPTHFDDEQVSIGEGAHARLWALGDLPAAANVDWAGLAGVPKALVTGSNGKTTTVRLITAMLETSGTVVGHSCTDGLVVGGAKVASGDYSGPVGARTVLRDPRVQAAVLEVARGGMLRRGLAVTGARASVVTNISSDHLGDYGIDTLDDIAGVKIVVAKALAPDGVLVANADDPVVTRHALATGRTAIAWFALELGTALGRGSRACGAADGHLVLADGDRRHDLGEITAMPLTMGGTAGYNIANAAAAALAACAMGVPPALVAAVLGRFGSSHADNPGRLQHWRLGDVEVLMDYAHNPDGLGKLLHVAASLRGSGRFALLLGHAGDRRDDDYRALAAVAASAGPDRIWLKDLGPEYLRGRALGEIPAILGRALLEQGVAPDALPVCPDETTAVRQMLAWAAPGDLLLLPVHTRVHRTAVAALLDQLQHEGWSPGRALPTPTG
ncbi:Mur ligase family protein [Intrasporangium sp.]|uniref:Mur ligase family protein n=1 Tax=Intrasporangium sp. TaxID=1925024 RepID=UPI0032221849